MSTFHSNAGGTAVLRVCLIGASGQAPLREEFKDVGDTFSGSPLCGLTGSAPGTIRTSNRERCVTASE
jgi:hypothetical protein